MVTKVEEVSLIDAGPCLVVANCSSDLQPELIKVALTFRGRRKLVRLLSTTLAGDVLKLCGGPHVPVGSLVLVDRDGFEVGANVPIDTLSRDCDDLLELAVQVDEWATGGGD